MHLVTLRWFAALPQLVAFVKQVETRNHLLLSGGRRASERAECSRGSG